MNDLRYAATVPDTLLIMSCSQRKILTTTWVPAHDLYDGPTYRVLRKHIRNGGARPEIHILSAEYGLISIDRRVGNYDRQMDRCRADELINDPVDLYRFISAARGKRSIVFVGGKYYRRVIEAFAARTGEEVEYIRGEIGEQLAGLKHFLGGLQACH